MPALHPAVHPRDLDLGKHRTPDSGNGNFIHNWAVTLANQICGVGLKKKIIVEVFEIFVLED